MTVQEIYDLAVEMGIKADPRGENGIKDLLIRTKKEYEELPEKEKKFFDKETLTNPFADSRILNGDPETKVSKIITGIDVDTGEVVLTDRLNEKGEKIDLIIGHHPHGAALAALDEVMGVQVDLMESFGVPVNTAEFLMDERTSQVRRGIAPANHYQSVDAARLLNIPFMVIHTIWDNLGFSFLSKHLNSKKLQTVGDAVDAIEELPEFVEGRKRKAGPRITIGSRKNRAGKIAVTGFTGGTSGHKEIYEKLSHSGIGTIIEMHMNEEHFKEAKKHHLNVIIAGHIASDSLGANLFLDELEKRGVEIITFSGLIRVKRNNPSIKLGVKK